MMGECHPTLYVCSAAVELKTGAQHGAQLTRASVLRLERAHEAMALYLQLYR